MDTTPNAASPSTLARQGIVMFAAVGVLNVSSYAFHISMSRLLTPERYGAVGALVASFGMIAVPAGAIQAAVAKRVALAGSAEAKDVIGRSLVVLGAIALVVAVAVAAGSRAIMGFLHLASTGPVLVLAVYVVFALTGPVTRGGLQGLSRFGPLAIALALMGVLRVGVGVPFVALGWGVTGAAAAYVLAEAAGLLIGTGFLGRPRVGSTRHGVLGGAGSAMLALGGFWAMVSIDGVLARHFFPTDASGHYAAAYVVGRAVLFLPMAIHIVAFPRFARGQGRTSARTTLALALVVTGVLGAAATLVVAIAGSRLLPLVFGRGYEAASEAATALALAMAFNAMTNVLVYFHLASGSKAAYLSVPAVAVEAVGIVAFHGSIVHVALVAAAVASGVFVASLAAALRSGNGGGRRFLGDVLQAHDAAADPFP